MKSDKKFKKEDIFVRFTNTQDLTLKGIRPQIFEKDFSIKAQIKLVDSRKTIGSFTVLGLNNDDGEIVFNDMMMEIADAVDGSFFNCLEAINLDGNDFDISNEELFDTVRIKLCFASTNIFYVDNVLINPMYRNRGAAQLVLSSLPEMLKRIVPGNNGIIMLAAKPQEVEEATDEFKVAEEALFRLYEKSGFTRIQDNVFLCVF